MVSAQKTSAVKPDDTTIIKRTYSLGPFLLPKSAHTAGFTKPMNESRSLNLHLKTVPTYIKFAKESENKSFIISTEIGVVDRLKRDCPEKEFFLISEKAVCHNMKWIHLEDILNSLKFEQYEINVDEEIAKKAVKCIDRMLEVSK